MKINKLFIISLLMLIALTSLASATINWTSEIEMFMPLMNVTDSTTGLIDLTLKHNGTALNGVTFTNSSEDSFYFDGSNDYVRIPYSSAFNLNGDHTISYWYKHEIPPDTALPFGFLDNNDDGYALALIGSKMKFVYNEKDTYGNTVLNADQTYFINIVIDNSITEEVRIYIDGVEETYSQQESITGETISVSTDFSIGNRLYDTALDLKGELNSMIIINKILSQTEINNLYSEGRTYNPYGEAPPVTYFDITAIDSRDNSSISTFNTSVSTLLNTSYGWSTLINHWTTVSNYTQIDKYLGWTEGISNKQHEKIDSECLVNNSGLIQIYLINGGAPFFKLYCRDENGSSHYISNDWYLDSFYLEDYYFNETYSTTNGTIRTGIDSTSGLKSLILKAEHYYDETELNYNVSSDLEVSFDRLKYNINFAATQIITSNYITPFNITLENGTNITNGTYAIYDDFKDFNFTKTNYYNATLTNQTIDSDKTLTFSNVYQSILTLIFKDYLTNITINDTGYFNYTYDNITTQAYTTDGTFTINTLYGDYETISKATGFAFYEEDFTISTALITKYFQMYKENGIYFYAKDFITETNLSNFSVILYNDDYSYEGSNTTGELIKLYNMTPDIYKVVYSKENYSNANYVVTIGAGSHQTLTAYMIEESTSSTTTFTVENIISKEIIPNAIMSMYKLYNTTWNLVSSQFTDITGRTQFQYIDDEEYKFVIDKTNYTQRNFLLEPLFSTYTIRLTPTDVEVANYNIGDWLFYTSNDGLYYNDLINNVTISIASGRGTIEYYDLHVTYDNTTQSFNCINALGCSDDIVLNISGAAFGEIINVSYDIKEVGQDEKTFTIIYNIWDDYQDNTFLAFQDNTSLDDLEKGVIVSLSALILLGIISIVSISLGVPPVTPNGIALTMVMYFFAYVGFIPTYAAHLVGFGALLIVLFGRGRI